MLKNKKNNLDNRREFYIYRVIRDGKMYDDNETERKTITKNQKETDSSSKSIHKKTISYAESVGYREDPKRYDNLRPKKSEDKPELKENQIIDFVEPPREDKTIGYYDAGNEIPGTPDKPTFIITDLNGKVYYSQYKSYYSNKFHYSTGYPLHRFGSNIYFNPPFNDTIFEVNKNSFKAKYAFNIAGGNHLHIDETTTDDDFREQMRNIDYFNSHFIDLKDVAVFHYMSNVDYLTWGVYVKSEDRTYENNGKCKNPLFSFFHIPWFYYGDNTIVVPVSASKIVGARNDILQKCDSKLAELLLDGLTEDDNPILLFYHMKTKMQ